MVIAGLRLDHNRHGLQKPKLDVGNSAQPQEIYPTTVATLPSLVKPHREVDRTVEKAV
jgi:hypothetical protein